MAADPRADSPIARLTILYDDACTSCLRGRAWMERQPVWVELRFLSWRAPDVRRAFSFLPWLGDQLVVVADDGRVWAGPQAFVVCLWALRDYRVWSYRVTIRTRAHSPCADPACAMMAKRNRGPYR